jgi:hypothetical protein
MSVEHRAAASISTVQMLLDTTDGEVALRTLDHGANATESAPTEPAAAELSLEQRLIEHLAAASTPLTATALRKLCQVRNTTLQAALAVLVEGGHVLKDRAGYARAR